VRRIVLYVDIVFWGSETIRETRRARADEVKMMWYKVAMVSQARRHGYVGGASAFELNLTFASRMYRPRTGTALCAEYQNFGMLEDCSVD
jgi:hypothetical protein